MATIVLILFASSIPFWGIDSWIQDSNSYFNIYEAVSSEFGFKIPNEPIIPLLFFIFPDGMSLRFFTSFFYFVTLVFFIFFAKRAFKLSENETKLLFCLFVFLMISNRLVLDNILVPTRFSLALIFFLIALASGKTKIIWMVISISTHNLAGLFGLLIYLTHKFLLLLRVKNVFLFIFIFLFFLFTIFANLHLHLSSVPRLDRFLLKLDFGLSPKQYFQVVVYLVVPWIFIIFSKTQIDWNNEILRVSFLAFVILIFFSYLSGLFLRISLLAASGPYLFLPIRLKVLLLCLQALVIPAIYFLIFM